MKFKLTDCQAKALEKLKSSDHLFLTGFAGSGKSTTLSYFLKNVVPASENSSKRYPVLASTGAAAVLIGGRTFHSFFGLGILEGGVQATIEKALENYPLKRRLKAAETVIVDEISMISGTDLEAAEKIARLLRNPDLSWGGLRVIVVGDFAQLPPVNRSNRARDWAFLSNTWARTGFDTAFLKTNTRTTEKELSQVLNFIRYGEYNETVSQFLEAHLSPYDEDFTGTRLLPHRDTAERFNSEKLDALRGKKRSFVTEYSGKKTSFSQLQRSSPIPDVLDLKEEALVMLRVNDPEGRYFNGSLGTITRLEKDKIELTLLDKKTEIEIEPFTFTLLDAEGTSIATARNFPLTLAYATTIHKAQGATLDRVWVDLQGAWEHGQAYVALSRVRKAKSLQIGRWTEKSFVVDPAVLEFEQSIINLGQ